MTDSNIDSESASRFFKAIYDTSISVSLQEEPSLIDITCVLAGAVSELSLETDAPDITLIGITSRISTDLSCGMAQGSMPAGILPPAYEIDKMTEAGRMCARSFWESEEVCERSLDASLRDVAVSLFIEWESVFNINRAKFCRILHEIALKALAFEFAAQELCDCVIERRLITDLWGAGECITALSAAAGRRQALGLGGAYVRASDVESATTVTYSIPMQGDLEELSRVMTREAVAGGVDAGSDWRFGLAANDMPLNAPVDLIRGIEPVCQGFFRAITLPSWRDQAVACAKAAGRMLAVTAGGSLPDIEPAIAKPLAMSAMAETYKYVSYSRASMSG